MLTVRVRFGSKIAALFMALAVPSCGAGSQPMTAGAPEPPPVARTSPPPAPVPRAPAATPEPQASPKPPLNVLLILVDSLRWDMPWAGYPRQIAPNLTRLEAESVSYRRAYSVSSYTAKSVGALLSGKYPSTLKRNGYFFTRYSQEALFFPELLQSSGVRTMSAHAHRTMKQDNNLNQGFDHWEVVAGIGPDTRTDDHVTSDDLTELALRMLERNHAVEPLAPFFLYLHYLDPHRNYLKHREAPDFGDRARDRYDAEVFFTDLWIGRLLEHCKSQPWFERTAVIVSADHGEAFGEHGMYRHAFELWNVLTHVPLFIRLPAAAPRTIDVPRSHIDLAPTIVELLGRRSSGDFAGRSLVSELFGQAPEPRPVLLDLPADSNNAPRRAIIDGQFKLLVLEDSGQRMLFDLVADPGELEDLSQRRPDKLAELSALFAAHWKQQPSVRPYGGNRLVGGGIADGPR
jgi:arylsulfatase A-like enzyme